MVVSLQFHPHLVAAVQRAAEVQAIITAEFLKWLREELSARGESLERLPSAFLLEIGALGQIARWEADGLIKYVRPTLPTFDQAAADIHSRSLANPGQFFDTASASLSRLVFQTILNRVGWDAPSILRASVAIDCDDESKLVDAIAQLVWSLRHCQFNAVS